jgi:hypothetical protein
MDIILQFLSNANKISSCGDSKAPSVPFEVRLHESRRCETFSVTS